jgi:hypothetical protein
MNCPHKNLKVDEFARIPSVKRYVPGNAVCVDCGNPVPFELVGKKAFEIKERETTR